jgi:hypothetical protein
LHAPSLFGPYPLSLSLSFFWGANPKRGHFPSHIFSFFSLYFFLPFSPLVGPRQPLPSLLHHPWPIPKTLANPSLSLSPAQHGQPTPPTKTLSQANARVHAWLPPAQLQRGNASVPLPRLVFMRWAPRSPPCRPRRPLGTADPPVPLLCL